MGFVVAMNHVGPGLDFPGVDDTAVPRLAQMLDLHVKEDAPKECLKAMTQTGSHSQQSEEGTAVHYFLFFLHVPGKYLES